MNAVAVLPGGRVVTGGGWSATRAGGCWCGTRPSPGDGPGRARPPRRRGGRGGGAAGRAGGHRRRRGGDEGGRVLVWDPATRAPARSSSAATTAGWPRWRCCRAGGWLPAAPRRPGAGVGPGRAGHRPGRVRPPRGRGGRGGGAAGRAGGYRRQPRRPGAGMGPDEPGTGPVEFGRHEGGVGAVAVLPGGQVVTGGYDDRVRLRNVQGSSPGTLLACSAYGLAGWSRPNGSAAGRWRRRAPRACPSAHSPPRSGSRPRGCTRSWPPPTSMSWTRGAGNSRAVSTATASRFPERGWQAGRVTIRERIAAAPAAAWRLDQAGRERTWALVPARAWGISIHTWPRRSGCPLHGCISLRADSVGP